MTEAGADGLRHHLRLAIATTLVYRLIIGGMGGLWQSFKGWPLWAKIVSGLVVLALLGGIGNSGSKHSSGAPSSQSTHLSATTPATTSAPTTASPESSSESRMCSLPEPSDRATCHAAYRGCAKIARAKVHAYYYGNGASLDVVAIQYGKALYGSQNFTWQIAEAGCLAALNDAYRRVAG